MRILLSQIHNPVLRTPDFPAKRHRHSFGAARFEEAIGIGGNQSESIGCRLIGFAHRRHAGTGSFAMLPIVFGSHSLCAMPFTYERTVHFADTDAAGVVFFANYLAICHEAYEESLSAAGINLKTFFADNGVVIPVAKSEAEYRRPLSCGDRLSVSVQPVLTSENSYDIRFEITRLGASAKSAARVRTEHVCIDSGTRARRALPEALSAWVRAG
jgi:1,4-dihydroxy-2-naphthoyl-CoA hydrolase